MTIVTNILIVYSILTIISYTLATVLLIRERGKDVYYDEIRTEIFEDEEMSDRRITLLIAVVAVFSPILVPVWAAFRLIRFLVEMNR